MSALIASVNYGSENNLLRDPDPRSFHILDTDGSAHFFPPRYPCFGLVYVIADPVPKILAVRKNIFKEIVTGIEKLFFGDRLKDFPLLFFFFSLGYGTFSEYATGTGSETWLDT